MLVAGERVEGPLTRRVAEILAAALGVEEIGRWRIELHFQDGELISVYRHEDKIPATSLGRHDAALAELLAARLPELAATLRNA